MPTLLAPVLQFAVHEDGTWENVSGWLPLLAVTADLLARADGRRLKVRGDELTFYCTNGGATYALGHEDGRGGCVGRLVRSW